MKWIYETNEDNSARFVLGQVFNENEKTLFCLGINPSTACPSCLDNTIRKVIKISKYNGYDNWIMLNIYPQRATDPNNLHVQCDENLIARNKQIIADMMTSYPNSDVLLAYSNLIEKRAYLKKCLDDIIAELVDSFGKHLKIIRLTKKNNPIHPLYQRDNSILYDFTFSK